MNISREEVVALAREAGFVVQRDETVFTDLLERLCNLTIAKSRLAEGEQELPTGECFKSYGALCARCGHDEFVLPAAPQGAPK